jgi:hypothetical protein
MFETEYWNELQDAIESLEIVSDLKYSFRGRIYVLPIYIEEKSKVLNDQISNKQYTISQIQYTLYQTLHCRISTEYQIPYSGHDDNYRQDFANILSLANTGKGTWDSGWQIRKIEIEGKHLAVHKDGLTIWVQRPQVC